MGIVNVTPDSFSDGGAFLETDAAVAHGLELAAEGAEILDIGGESTRPGAEPVSEVEELRRVIPVIEGLAAAVDELRRNACPRPRADFDRHLEGSGRAGRARGGREPGQRRERVPHGLGDGRGGRGQRRGVLLDAHARRAAHDAARSEL